VKRVAKVTNGGREGKRGCACHWRMKENRKGAYKDEGEE